MTLDDLIALNDEIAALVRAGVPLEAGLAELGGDLPGRLGRFAAALAERTARGESLAQAIAARRRPVAAGLSGGGRGRRPRGPTAGRAGSRGRGGPPARGNLSHRRDRRHVSVAAGLGGMVRRGVFCLYDRAAVRGDVRRIPRAGPSDSCRSGWDGKQRLVLGTDRPRGRVAADGRLVARQPREGRWAERLFGWVPWTGRMLRCSRTATFLELLALLVENQTPLPEAMVLAAEASGDPATLQAARQLAAALENGQTQPARRQPALPPLIRWLLLAAGRDGALLPAPAARRRDATIAARGTNPSCCGCSCRSLTTIAIGGSVTAVYALALFLPYSINASHVGKVKRSMMRLPLARIHLDCKSSRPKRRRSLPRRWPN